ncbi:hypothetical protein F0562_005838 [Nyssa sinensis]|uniref:Uncharacterized protein n=1 Tax=Nyssa sinensis TaxID=561372 RepID=A0A5J5ALR7_9ASTE|nr:hypothetical protein F0562_005838 [Nyssa sinensis]
MLPLKLVRSLVLGDTINNPLLLTQNHHDQYHDDIDHHNDSDSTKFVHVDPHNGHHKQRRTRRSTKNTIKPKIKTPFLLFMPTKELVTDTYRLATLARDIGMDLYPNPSLSHIIFSWPPSSASPSTSASSYPSLWSSTSLSSSTSSWSLPNDAVPLPFPSLSIASPSQLRYFASLSKGFFKPVFLNYTLNPIDKIGHQTSNWDCCSVSLISRLTGGRIDSMDSFSRALAGMGWTLFKTKNNPSADSGDSRIHGVNSVYLFRKVDLNRLRARQPSADGVNSPREGRIRELRLPPLDFRNAPLRILQYILLMTDDIFYLA